MGKKDRAKRVLERLLSPEEAHVEGAPIAFAAGLTCLGLGDRERALEQFNIACDERSYAVPAAYQLPEIQNLRSYPRFEEIEEKVGARSYLATRAARS